MKRNSQLQTELQNRKRYENLASCWCFCLQLQIFILTKDKSHISEVASRKYLSQRSSFLPIIEETKIASEVSFPEAKLYVHFLFVLGRRKFCALFNIKQQLSKPEFYICHLIVVILICERSMVGILGSCINVVAISRFGFESEDWYHGNIQKSSQ